MLQPKFTTHRKQIRGRMKGIATRGNYIAFGEYGLIACEPAWITQKQIESVRLVITRALKGKGKLWIRIFPDKPVTQNSPEADMGKGKGEVEFWVAVVKPNKVLFEVGGINEDMAREVLRIAASKLPIKTKILKKYEA